MPTFKIEGKLKIKKGYKGEMKCNAMHLMKFHFIPSHFKQPHNGT